MLFVSNKKNWKVRRLKTIKLKNIDYFYNFMHSVALIEELNQTSLVKQTMP